MGMSSLRKRWSQCALKHKYSTHSLSLSLFLSPFLSHRHSTMYLETKIQHTKHPLSFFSLTHTHIDTYRHTDTHRHTHKRTHKHTPSLSYTHIHTLSILRTDNKFSLHLSLSHTHTHTHTNTHTHTRTHFLRMNTLAHLNKGARIATTS